ncbi:hypothetical protein SERLA73DRAFT_145103 [Serpula lacrymans var. lacrymans S7.3]|uniref:Uncharacterized protein n=2 Tax=Serpula lacrymans var. lacrymans TaxID=341189 RepID=F8QD14_SERL3|nr:uncharacterized protein SERLADRAFT_402906 [Serpula lacrymans var. lacrymans S7.9]EGN94029.1 hypothetical protein SERLA73DRAFT_145103 [Serpula lacrymans var. lacrymans S7.3]EGO19382.1 hypothetical protein SERLADRAFT_402906 [Serpula lacrymans var. lacrymans S7.9]
MTKRWLIHRVGAPMLCCVGRKKSTTGHRSPLESQAIGLAWEASVIVKFRQTGCWSNGVSKFI